MSKIGALGRSMAVSKFINNVQNFDYNRMRNEEMQNKLVEFRRERAEYNKPRMADNIYNEFDPEVQPIVKQVFRRSGYVNPNGEIRAGRAKELIDRINKDPGIQAGISSIKYKSALDNYNGLKKIQTIKDPKERKQAFAQFGIKEEEYQDALKQSGSMVEFSKARYVNANKTAYQASEAMKRARLQAVVKQASAKETGTERSYKRDMELRKRKGKPIVPYNKWKDAGSLYRDYIYAGESPEKANALVEQFLTGENTNTGGDNGSVENSDKKRRSELWK